MYDIIDRQCGFGQEAEVESEGDKGVGTAA